MNKIPGQSRLRYGRYDQAGFYYFITTITFNREKIFSYPVAAETVINSLNWLHDNSRLQLFAAVIMLDHIHFVAQLKDSSLSKLMHSLKSLTANKINEALHRTGYLWEHQYYEHALRDERGLLEAVKYCLENPVRKGLVENFKDYPYWLCIYDL